MSQESSQVSNRINHNHPAKPFPKGNKLATGGKREGAGRKSRKIIEDERTAQQKFDAILEAAAERLAYRTVKRALTQSDPVLIAAGNRISPPKQEDKAPTVTINFVMFNPSSSGNDARVIDVSSSSSSPSSPVVDGAQAPVNGPRLTFTDIVEK